MNEEYLVRSIKYGKVRGTEEGKVLVWYAVPYGKEPVGRLRWQPPQDPDPWRDIYDAAKPGEIAMQLTETGVVGTTDCLNLDIYSTNEAEKRPVLVFLHGGNNQNGTSLELKGNDLVIRDEIVYVSINFRLGLLGFNCLPALCNSTSPERVGKNCSLSESMSGNFTLMDIAKALDWIKENIAVFGGDPGNITVSGFSAGGRDVAAMLISPLFAGKFQKALVFSGGMTTAEPRLSACRIAEFLAPVVIKDGMAVDKASAIKWLLGKSSELKQYLYGLSDETLCSLVGGAAIRMSAFPHLFTDGEILPEEGFDTEEYYSVPILMLSGTTEFSCFVHSDSFFAEWFAAQECECGENRQTNIKTEDADMEMQQTDAVSGKYHIKWKIPAQEFAIYYGSRLYRWFNTDASAEQMADHYCAPMYLCNINYGNADSDYPIPDLGSFHGIFLPMLSAAHNCMGVPEGTFENPAYQQMAGLFHGYLKKFLYTGDPNGISAEKMAGSNEKSDSEVQHTKGITCRKGSEHEWMKWPVWDKTNRYSLTFDGKDDTGYVQCESREDSFEKICRNMEQDTSIPEDLKLQVIRNVLNGRWFSRELDQTFGCRDLWKQQPDRH